MKRVDSECDPQLLADMDALIDTISKIRNSLDEIDGVLHDVEAVGQGIAARLA
jgi:hypothetical protein